MTWCFRDEVTKETQDVLRRLAQAYALVPTVWQFEVANVLRTADRRGRLPGKQALDFLTFLKRFDIRVTPVNSTELLDLAARSQLTVYDASYLLLAIQNDCPLATLDKKLQRAAIDLNIQVLPT